MSKGNSMKDTVLLVGISLAASIVTEKVLLMPAREIQISPNKKVTVKGVFALSQNAVAKTARVALNKALPVYAKTVSGTFNYFGVKRRVRDNTVWFIYDFLGRYSLNSVLSYFISKKQGFDKDSYKNALNDIIKKYISEKSDREVIVNGITNEIVHILRTLCDGTLLSVIFNDRFAEALAETLSATIDRFIEDEAATRLTDFFFDLADHLEKMTIPNFLINVLGITKEKMASQLDLMYDLMLGDKMVEAFENARYGDAMYEAISQVDFDKVIDLINREMKLEVLKIYASSVSVAICFNSEMTAFATTVGKHLTKANKRLNSVRGVLH